MKIDWMPLRCSGVKQRSGLAAVSKFISPNRVTSPLTCYSQHRFCVLTASPLIANAYQPRNGRSALHAARSARRSICTTTSDRPCHHRPASTPSLQSPWRRCHPARAWGGVAATFRISTSLPLPLPNQAGPLLGVFSAIGRCILRVPCSSVVYTISRWQLRDCCRRWR